MQISAIDTISSHAKEFGFLSGPSGAQSSQTKASEEFQRLPGTVPADADNDKYAHCFGDKNLVLKATLSKSQGVFRRCRDLHTPGKSTSVFRVVRKLRALDSQPVPWRALLAACVCNPFLRATISDFCGTEDSSASSAAAGPCRPTGGSCVGWPKAVAELRVPDPACGSGHFLVAAVEL